jgi:hypothetical protein
MYRVVLAEGEITCNRYETAESGVELYTENDEFIGFVPYSSCHAILNEEVYVSGDENPRSIL